MDTWDRDSAVISASLPCACLVSNFERSAERLMPGACVDAAAAYGALHMRAAVLAARTRRLRVAHEHLTEARQIAQRVPEGVYCGTVFGPASVQIHQITLAVDVGDPDSALRIATDWTPPADLPAERRSHFHVDLARAHSQVGARERSLESLTTARHVAPEHIRESPDARRVLSDLLQSGLARTEQVIEFARWARLGEPGG
jgi:hypothetical protein